MYRFPMSAGLRIRIDRDAAASLTEQISRTIRAAILDGRLEAGARLPSWRDLAIQLGVARGTGRAAYERLADELLVTASGPGGTHVTARPPRAAATAPAVEDRMPRYPIPAMPFQMGVPAYDAPGVAEMAGLTLMLRLPPGTDDVALESAALAHGLAPAALSSWYATSARAPGLLLSVTNLADAGLQRACDRLRALVERA